MRNLLFTLAMLQCAPALAAGAIDCNVPPPDRVRDNALYFYDSTAPRGWKLVRNLGPVKMPVNDVLLAYGIADGRSNSGMTLFKITDSRSNANWQDHQVQLTRNITERYDRRGQRHLIKAAREVVDAEVYQDIHMNPNRDINRALRRFHGEYAYANGANRDTFDLPRRDAFLFEQLKTVDRPKSLLSYIFGASAIGGLRSDEGTLSLRAKLKYYSKIAANSGSVICFTFSLDNNAEQTRVTAVDFDYVDQMVDPENRPAARHNEWTIRWKQSDAEADYN